MKDVSPDMEEIVVKINLKFIWRCIPNQQLHLNLIPPPVHIFTRFGVNK
jgi:hypothetical protein